MIEVQTHPLTKDEGQFLFVVIVTRYQNQWMWVKHRERDTWELPGGHIEKGESADEAAKRELFEETGALKFSIEPICDYSVRIDNKYGVSRLYFAEIDKLGLLPESEIECTELFTRIPDNLTYPLIQPVLFKKALELKMVTQ